MQECSTKASWSTVLVCATLLMATGAPARAMYAQGVNFLTENNTNANDISSAKPGMPVTLQTLTASVWLGSDPWPGMAVYFSIVSGSGVYLPVSSGVTNSNGQVMIVIKGTGSEGPTGYTVVQAKYYDPGGIGHAAQVTIHSVTEGWTGSDTPVINPPLLNGTAIRWSNHTAEMGAYISDAMQSATISGHIGFTAGSNPQVEHFDYDSTTDGAAAYTQRSTNYAAIYYNGINLGASRWLGISSNCPLGFRHHVDNTAGHELGHALCLGHNGADDHSLMWANLRNYWIWGTQVPQQDEIHPLLTQY